MLLNPIIILLFHVAFQFKFIGKIFHGIYYLAVPSSTFDGCLLIFKKIAAKHRQLISYFNDNLKAFDWPHNGRFHRSLGP